MSTNSVFQDFLRDIEPSRTTKARASSAHTALRDFLSDHEDFGEVHVKTFLSGSYKRDTAIPDLPEPSGKRPKYWTLFTRITGYGRATFPIKQSLIDCRSA
jgi:hypothetical protein